MAFEASLVSMNSRHHQPAGDGAQFGLEHGYVAAGVEPGGGKLVVGVAQHVEDGARPVAAEIARPARAGANILDVAAVVGELFQRAAGARGMFADDGDGRLDFGHHAHVAEQLLGAAEVLADREEQGQPALHVGVDVLLAVLDFVGSHQFAIDEIAAHGLHVGGVGEDAEAGGPVVRGLRRRGHLLGLDEADPYTAVAGVEEAQEALAIAVLAADDPLLPLVPAVFAGKGVEHRLRLADQLGRAITAPRAYAVTMPVADDVVDAVFVAVDGELVAHRQFAALAADLPQLGLGGKGQAGAEAHPRGRAEDAENKVCRPLFPTVIVPRVGDTTGQSPCYYPAHL